MKEQFEKTLNQITKAMRESLEDLKGAARDKSRALIDDWLLVFPELEKMGLEVKSFGVTLGISPGLEVELTGPGDAFTIERINVLLAEYEGSRYVTYVLKTIRTARQMHKKIGKTECEKIFLEVIVGIPPEVRVYLGKPEIL